MAPPKNKAAAEAVEKVILEAVEPITHDGQATAPGKTFLVNPDDVERLLESGLAKVPDLQEEEAK